MVVAAPLSALEMPHPLGVARRSRVAGAALPEGLAPLVGGDPPYDRVVLATGSAAPMDEEIARLDARARIRRRIAGAGLSVELEIIHLPDVASSVVIAPFAREPLRWAIGQLIVLGRWRPRAPVALLRLRRLAGRMSPQLGLVVRRPGSTPALRWLSAASPADVTSAVVRRVPGRPGSLTVMGFSAASRAPLVVAKVAPAGDPRLAREEAALKALGGGAREAGAAVPTAVASRRLDSSQVRVFEALDGRLAATLIAAAPHEVDRAFDRVMTWLEGWSRRTCRRSTITRETLDELLLQPAERGLGGVREADRYMRYLERICAEAAGHRSAVRAAHIDLTMWNVLLGRRGELAVLDWEAATETSLPLVDPYYAAVDVAAATLGYADRVEAFGRCVSHGTADARRIAAWERRLASALGLETWMLELAFHASWLHHAANETAAEGATRDGSFTAILEPMAASIGSSFGGRYTEGAR